MTQIDQATILITGAAGGFGQELTRQLLQAGGRLILTDLNREQLQQQVAAIRAEVTGGEVMACLEADLAGQAGCDRTYQQVQALGQPVDILINNAGLGLYGRLDELPEEHWERLMQVNLLAPMRLSARFMANMIARRQGHIVNISSLAGWIAPAGLAPYGASKFGLRGLSESLYLEGRPHRVRVTAVYPFFSRTPILQSERFGTLARQAGDRLPPLTTDPATVMRATIRGIERNQRQVFPDPMARLSHALLRLSPQGVPWITDVITQRLTDQADARK